MIIFILLPQTSSLQAKHNLTFGYMGIWNEMPYQADFVEELRTAMDTAGFEDTQIVASDSDGVCKPSS